MKLRKATKTPSLDVVLIPGVSSINDTKSIAGVLQLLAKTI